MRSSWHSGSTSRLLAIALCVGVLMPAVANAESSPLAPVNSTDGIAIKGYDPVADSLRRSRRGHQQHNEGADLDYGPRGPQHRDNLRLRPAAHHG